MVSKKISCTLQHNTRPKATNTKEVVDYPRRTPRTPLTSNRSRDRRQLIIYFIRNALWEGLPAPLAACAYFVAAIRRTNSNQFEFVRQIAATKFCRSGNDFHSSHEAICCINLSRRRVAAICRIVCLGLSTC